MQIKKSQKASLEDKKLTYVLLGFVFVLSLCYVALEWTEQEVTKYEVADMDFQFEEEIEIQQTSQRRGRGRRGSLRSSREDAGVPRRSTSTV